MWRVNCVPIFSPIAFLVAAATSSISSIVSCRKCRLRPPPLPSPRPSTLSVLPPWYTWSRDCHSKIDRDTRVLVAQPASRLPYSLPSVSSGILYCSLTPWTKLHKSEWYPSTTGVHVNYLINFVKMCKIWWYGSAMTPLDGVCVL